MTAFALLIGLLILGAFTWGFAGGIAESAITRTKGRP